MSNWQPPTIPAPPAPQPARESWFARHKILTLLIALVAILVVAQAFNSGSDPATVTGQAAPSQAADQPADAPKEAAIGTPVRDGQLEFTVTKVKPGVTRVGGDVLGENAQGQFVLVHITVENIGAEAQLFADSSQKVRDAEGREFSADTAAAISLEDNDVFLNEINPGNTVKGVLVFDMPKDAKPASIELHDSPFSGGVTVRLG